MINERNVISRKVVVKYLIMLCVCIFYVFGGGMQAKAETTCKSSISYPAITKDKVNIRKKAGTNYKSYGMLQKDQSVTILGWCSNRGVKWYKCRATVRGKKKTGYIRADYIKLKAKATGYVNDKVTSKLSVRQSARTSAKSLMKIPKNTKVSIRGIKKVSGKYWYKVKVTRNNKTKKGYVFSTYIDVESTQTTTPEEEKQEEVKKQTEEEFELSLSYFPVSYHAAIRAMHAEYPYWRFVAVNTNLDWATVVRNESVVGRNVIQSNYPAGTGSLAPFSYLSTEAGAYDWATDQYVVKDGTNWYCANSEVIAYYMDPRNFLNSTDVFQFEMLAYDATQNISVVQSILSNTFMNGNYSVYDSAAQAVVTGSYGQAFMDAGVNAAANPYFLATRVKQEVGLNGSGSTSGTYTGYEGIYNFYNIGAFDGKDAVARGLQWAKGGASGATTYGRPWTSPYKSIVGGAQYIANNYINKGQNTLYFQKFNVKPNNLNDLYLNQYMTNVQAPYSEGRITKEAYQTMGILSNTMTFCIPVYNNMPDTACNLPVAAGNPNPYLSSVKLYNGTTELTELTTAFRYNQFEYSILVPMAVTSLKVDAKAVSAYATVTGTGEIALPDPGSMISVQVSCVAQNGTTQLYTIHITRDVK